MINYLDVKNDFQLLGTFLTQKSSTVIHSTKIRKLVAKLWKKNLQFKIPIILNWCKQFVSHSSTVHSLDSHPAKKALILYWKLAVLNDASNFYFPRYVPQKVESERVSGTDLTTEKGTHRIEKINFFSTINELLKQNKINLSEF